MTSCWSTKEKLLELFTGRVEEDVIELLIQNRDKNCKIQFTTFMLSLTLLRILFYFID